ncbi:ribonuclease H-like domain-containing protein [Tanacetum coccineum]|uniref:Ribonuclease H-like domain-containing protein n=1 Tax=Tanacetum coccineum TaxID=301880 RepID=A0ABQ5D2S5_9ASTR
MVTRAQVGIVKPNPRFQGHISHICPLPKSLFVALSDPSWRDAMYDEYNALIKNSTWILVSKPPNVNVVRSMWLFQHKYHADGSLSRYKARLVTNRRSHQFSVDCGNTFSPMVKPAAIRTVRSLALSRNWPIHQLDVKNSFLNGDLSKTVYIYQLAGFVDARFPHHVCRLQRHGSKLAYLLIYVDDIVLTASSTDLLRYIICSLHKEFDMTNLGALNCFLGISVTRDSTFMFLSQKKYALELLDRAHMASCNPTRTPIDTESKLGSNRDPYNRLQLYASSTGSLVAYFNADWAGCPSTRRSTSGYCVFFGDIILSWSSKQQHTLFRSSAEVEYRGVANVVTKTAWLCNLLRELDSPLLRSTFGYCVFFGDNILSWSSKQQHTLFRSSAEAEYRGVANVVTETAWLCNLLRELDSPLLSTTLVYSDNVSAIYMTANTVQHQRIKHIEITGVDVVNA